ncbi:MAG: cyanoexosortase A system-associated protein [Fischerella sp.]|jgi:cyanosortase A-associated protein|uniref:cyanoexosortase A system-associated protein n=1 Tax=Fischerella sp. TaxID=1191 RepID=UPI00179AD403|nr:cyanoexosortase A system-associated protein [Fischerella sp.]NWF61454.1 cyanoexosortase A system-associated protein [Fischerella sp.]
MRIWKKLRLSLLILTSGSIFFVLGLVILLPKQYNRTATPIIFPEAVSIPNWQFKSSSSLPLLAENYPELIAQRNYQYALNSSPLDIEMRYVKTSIGDVKTLIRKYTEISSFDAMRQQEGVGYYGLGFDQKRAYLSACINPEGKSTFDGKQFKQHQQKSDRRWQRLLPWLLGQEKLTNDRYCLLAHLSIPLNASSPEAAYKVLEKAWFTWYQDWRYRLPKH